MTDLAGFRTLQKIRYFLAAAFPFLARAGPWEWDFAGTLQRFPRVARAWQRVRKSAFGAAVQRVANTFVLGHYGSDRLDWTRVPRDAVGVLRTTIVVAALLCLLVPLATSWTWPPLSAEAITGTRGSPVAGWSVVLWMAALSLGWSALLAGTGAANRATFAPALLLFLYFSAAMVAALPKSWWSLLAPLVGALAIVHCESQPRSSRRWDRRYGALTAIITGAMTAALAIIVVPTRPWFRGWLLFAALVIGTPLGMLLWLIGQKLQRRAIRGDAEVSPLRLDVVVGGLAALHALLLASLVARGGVTIPAGSIQALAVQMTGFLWPLYFFVGAGVVFKVLRQTTAVQRVVEEALPARIFVPVTMTLLVVAAGVAWIKPILLTPAFPWPGWLVGASEWLYGASGWLWHSSLARRSIDPMKWVLLGALIVAAWALIRRRLTSSGMARILFLVVLVAFAVGEYFFQAFGFVRTPSSSALSLLIFTALVLWLVHRTALPYLMGESRAWPARARIALYGALLMFVLLPIHARAASHDPAIANEIFLYLFFGAINFGLPYYLYLYARRRFSDLPLSATAALGAVLLGAAISVLLILADKAAVAGWSISAAWASASAQAQGLIEGRRITVEAFLPTTWVVLRGLLVVGALAAIGLAARRRTRDPRNAHASVVFSIVGVAAGLACFSNRGLELPLLPQQVVFLIAPLHSSAIVDASLVARQLSILLPALMLALAFDAPHRRVRQATLVVAAATVHVAITLLWPAREPWLRSTGALFALGAIAFMMLALLAMLVRRRLDNVRQATSLDDASVAGPAPLLQWREMRVAAAALVVLLSVFAGYRLVAGRSTAHAIAAPPVVLRFPVSWNRLAPASPVRLTLTRDSWSGTQSRLWAELRQGFGDSTSAFLLRAAIESPGVASIEPMNVERWDQFSRGAVALDFRVIRPEGDDTSPGFGTTAVAPLPNGNALLMTILYDSIDGLRRWDLARALQTLPR